MNSITQNAVDRVRWLLKVKRENPARYESQIGFGADYAEWDDPKPPVLRPLV